MLELVARVLLSLVGAVAEWLLTYFFYACGWLVLRLLTLGNYPRLPLHVSDPMNPHSSWVAAFGIFCVVGMPLTVLVFLYG